MSLPQIAGAERTRWDLGVTIPAGMDALMADVPGWRSLAPHEIRRLGLPTARVQELVAGMTTREVNAQLGFTLVRRSFRGEYRAVTFLLALERSLRVRTNIRLTAVDRVRSKNSGDTEIAILATLAAPANQQSQPPDSDQVSPRSSPWREARGTRTIVDSRRTVGNRPTLSCPDRGLTAHGTGSPRPRPLGATRRPHTKTRGSPCREARDARTKTLTANGTESPRPPPLGARRAPRGDCAQAKTP